MIDSSDAASGRDRFGPVPDLVALPHGAAERAHT